MITLLYKLRDVYIVKEVKEERCSETENDGSLTSSFCTFVV